MEAGTFLASLSGALDPRLPVHEQNLIIDAQLQDFSSVAYFNFPPPRVGIIPGSFYPSSTK
jgi:hypothetical protein